MEKILPAMVEGTFAVRVGIDGTRDDMGAGHRRGKQHEVHGTRQHWLVRMDGFQWRVRRDG